MGAAPAAGASLGAVPGHPCPPRPAGSIRRDSARLGFARLAPRPGGPVPLPGLCDAFPTEGRCPRAGGCRAPLAAAVGSGGSCANALHGPRCRLAPSERIPRTRLVSPHPGPGRPGGPVGAHAAPASVRVCQCGPQTRSAQAGPPTPHPAPRCVCGDVGVTRRQQVEDPQRAGEEERE